MDKPVEDLNLKKGITLYELLKQFKDSGGFTAKKISVALDILNEMKSEDTTVFLSFPACIVATGTRGVIKEMVKEKIVDVIITTCGTLDHDLARLWKDYYQGDFLANDAELYSKGISRVGSVFIPRENYGLILEEKLLSFFEDVFSAKNPLATYELVWEIGKRIKNHKKASESIIYWCYQKKVPMFIPGITDGAVGSILWMVYQKLRFPLVDVFKDEDKLSEIVFNSKKTGAIVVGGGISKHHLIWWNQFIGGLDYAIYITTAVEWNGSLSGARASEAISWGKIKPDASFVTIEGDATVILPLLIGAFLDSKSNAKTE